MKTFLTIITLFFPFMVLSGQSNVYKKIEGELMLGIFTSSQKVGLSTGLELRYNINDKISFGVKYEPIVLINKDEIDTSNSETEIERIFRLQNFALTGEYYLINGKRNRRVFAGLALGLYNAQFALMDSDNITALGNKIGIAPRIGAELGSFRPTLKYHFMPKFGNESFATFDLSLGIVFGGKRR